MSARWRRRLMVAVVDDIARLLNSLLERYDEYFCRFAVDTDDEDRT